MDKKILKRYLRGNNRYSFMVDGYLFPKFLISTKNNIIDLEDNREQNLHQGSRWSPNFKNFLDTEYKSVRYIREFPIIIKDRKLWKSLCIKYQLDEDKLGRNYFLVDYFMPDFNLLVEIDSQLHEIDYDKARDEYIRLKYGLETLRFYEYGRYSYQTFENNFQFLKNYCRCHGSTPIKFNHKFLIMSSYIIINRKVIPTIQRFEKLVLSKKGINKIVLSRNNLSEAEYLLLLYKIKYLYEFINYFKTLYNIDVIIKP